jgi:hypothetical protein
MKGLAQVLCCILGAIVGLLILDVVWSNVYQPPPPISLSYRPDLVGQSVLVTFHNKSHRALGFMMQIKNPITEEGKVAGIHLQPYESKDVDWKGFKVESGDVILVISEGDKKTMFRIP